MDKTKPQIVMLKISEIIPYDNNPRINDDAVESVANSIKEFGFKVPIVLDKDKVIINGHTRFKASNLLGLKEVPCIIADDLTPEQVKALRVIDNKVAELSEWDIEKLIEEIKDIGEDEFIGFGFTYNELRIMTGEEEQDQEFEIQEDCNEDVAKILGGVKDYEDTGRLIITYENEEEETFLKNLLNEIGELKEYYKTTDIKGDK